MPTNVGNNTLTTKTSSDTILDTLELTSEIFESKTHETLYSKAIRKYLTNQKVKQIIDITGITKQWQKQYWKTWHCMEVILKVGDEIRHTRCKKRWCQNCARVQSADITNGYKEPLSQYKMLHHVILSRPNVKGRQLSSEMKKMIQCFQSIKDYMRKRGLSINGFRKLECTHNIKTDLYHPHFHILLDGGQQSTLLLEQWLIRNPQSNRGGQSIQLVTDDDYMREVSKYAAKDPVKDTETAIAAHTMYKAMKGKRVFQAFGNLRKVKIVKTPEEVVTEYKVSTLPTYGVYVYEQRYKTWIEADGSVLLNTLQIESLLSNKK